MTREKCISRVATAHSAGVLELAFGAPLEARSKILACESDTEAKYGPFGS
jgi:hypothetical protein